MQNSSDDRQTPTSFLEEHKGDGGTPDLAKFHNDTTTYDDDALHHAVIYSVPTLDTLGDESTPIHPHAPSRIPPRHGSSGAGPNASVAHRLEDPSATAVEPAETNEHLLVHPPSRNETPVRGNVSRLERAKSAPPRNSTPDRTPVRARKAAAAKKSPILHRSTISTSPMRPSSVTRASSSQSSRPSRTQQTHRGESSSSLPPIATASSHNTNSMMKKFRTRKTDRNFQREEDGMSVSIRNIPVAERVAFDKHKLMSTEEWFDMAYSHQVKTSGSASTTISMSDSSSLVSLRKSKLSPSLQHLKLLHKMQSIEHVRQLAFSPSVGLTSDHLFVPPPGEETFYDYVGEKTGTSDPSRSSKSRSRSHKKDGRYRSIDPVQATLAALPDEPPLLSNKKHRLPLRSDVGFPNASMEEIQKKQAEIKLETEWEDAAPGQWVWQS